jgi:hypothetical protein
MTRYIIQHQGMTFATISPGGHTRWTDLREDTGEIAVFLTEQEAQAAIDYIKSVDGWELQPVKVWFPD